MTQHKIYIDVSEFDTDKRKLVQDAFFKLGIKWLGSGYRYLDQVAEAYTNTYTNGDINGRLLYQYVKQPTEHQKPHVHTFNQLMKLAGMEEHMEREAINNDDNTFTKDMLISGEHIVEYFNGKRYLVAGDYLIGERGYDRLEVFKQDLITTSGLTIINKVYSGKGGYPSDFSGLFCSEGFNNYLYNENLILVADLAAQREAAKESAIKREKKLALSENIAKMEAELASMKLELEGM